MPKHGNMRKGSLQFYPRVRAKKILPRVKWDSLLNHNFGLLGFIGYKVSMSSGYVKDNTPDSHTKGKRVLVPLTIIECPPMKIVSVRFYKNKKLIGEVLNENLDKNLAKKIKLPKKVKKKIEDFENFDDIRLLIYSQVNKTNLKKTPDMTEIGLSGEKSEKIEFIKKNLQKEFFLKDFIEEDIVDIRGVTKGKGTQGPSKRFGLSLRNHKSEKGVRGPGSGGPWHPARVEYTQPMAGQMGYFTRVSYNHKIIKIGAIDSENINPKNGFKNYGILKNDYLIIYGSLPGPSKRQILITKSLRPTKRQKKKNYEFIELR